ncbi:MAG TPA: Spy/CpxP family protein refolding chaperone [Candidatus Lustribacter sp.]|jgi:Spy/CpxP family protein refolding chaperone|nr:Spy/CpxP family protein refolding chaperone [Candidatus Lustribacter sp.]
MMNRFVRWLTALTAVALALTAFTAGDLARGLIAPAAAQAQPGSGAPQGGGPGGAAGRERFAKMLQSLNLTDDQKNKIRAIMTDTRAKMKTLTDPQQKRDLMRDAFEKKIPAVLTPAQAAKMKAEAEAFRAQRQSNAPHS